MMCAGLKNLLIQGCAPAGTVFGVVILLAIVIIVHYIARKEEEGKQ